jgi:Ca2+-binding EF-hand superfamily protein
MNKLSFLGCAALLATAGAAAAQGPGPGPGPRPDRNADLTRAQVIERTDRAFARLDANGDGRFTPDEARARGEQRREQRMTRLFDRLDADRNGSITRAEMAQAHANRRGPGGPGAEGRRGHGGPGMRHRGMRHGGPGMRGMRGQRMFGEQGFVTREQFRERALARFDRADADHDGNVTAAERQAMRGQRRQHRQERRDQPN